MMSGELEQLRADVVALGTMVAVAASQTEQDQDSTAAGITRLENIVAGFIDHPPAAAGADQDDQQGDEAPGVMAWVDYATAEDWVTLAGWVDWLTSVYDLHEDRQVRPCWPAHFGVAEELAALRSAWLEAASRAREADGDALAFWHDRYLAPLMARINHMYGTRACQPARHTPVRVAPVTNRTLIEVRSAATPGGVPADAPAAAFTMAAVPS